MTIRIAMWSGPRNVSTALMRAFEARGDCRVIDEPLYAAYLQATGLDHPGRDAILAAAPVAVGDALAALEPHHRCALQYEKHMAQHWLPRWPLELIPVGPRIRHALLIRDPVSVVASYARVRGRPTLEDLGLLQQVRLHGALTRRGHDPVVLDGDELRTAPAAMLQALCAGLQIPFIPQMLSWAPGIRATDGVWAPHWYARVAASTGFTAPGPQPTTLPPRLAELARALRPAYDHLAARRLRPPGPG
ncbi:MAG TPA: HAD family hydrolase [Deltaproteobacteria bacterium]|nr:HAD family hydrolase [Deltaproteobacteria bacterium]